MDTKLEILYYSLKKQIGGKINKKWNEFKHNGVMFPPEYEKHNIPLIYDGNEIILDKDAEEYATLYAPFLDTEYINNPKFNKNFWKSWKPLLPSNITDFDKCDFTKIAKYLQNKRERRLNRSKEEKLKAKEERDAKTEKYKIATVDGKEQKVGNFMVEPPTLFRGRGCHPLMGQVKKRILHKDITLNLSKDAPVPPGEWGKVVHNKDSWWLASWKDTISGKTKYVWLSDSSDYKAASDKNKFEMARKLKKKMGQIKKLNEENLESPNAKVKQVATALYLIEKLALRVGNEKGKDQADTVGVSSLRVEHIQLLDNFTIKLDFLGKDSVRYVNKVTVEPQIYRNLESFVSGKDKKAEIFNSASPDDINKYLHSFMTGLTSKVFRTYNASNLFQRELRKISAKFENYNEDDKINQLLNEFNKANKKVAIMCNHQKEVNKNFSNVISKFDDRVKDQKKKKDKLKREIKKIQSKEGDLNKTEKRSIKSKTMKVKIINLRIKKYKLQKQDKIEMKNVSLGTSKVNYIDPRITVAFMKKHKLDVGKIFSSTLQNKFQWAFEVDENWKF